MIREKQITIKSTTIKIDIKIKFWGTKLKKKILKKYNNQKIKDQIWYNQQIIT
jgi:hypothetical protein